MRRGVPAAAKGKGRAFERRSFRTANSNNCPVSNGVGKRVRNGTRTQESAVRSRLRRKKHEEISYRRLSIAFDGRLGRAGYAADKPSIPVIVKDTTSFYWQIVFAGARKAGQDLHVKVPEFGATSESDITGQISILENRSPQRPRRW